MARVYLICGKICSGKSWYAKQLREAHPAVILSTDEVTYDLTDNAQGEGYNAFAGRVNRYLRKKAVQIVEAGADVILDWGFWTRDDRREISEYLRMRNVAYEWHYIDVSDAQWEKNIAERNRRIENGDGGPDFCVDVGLRNKVLSRFEIPAREEIDCWVRVPCPGNPDGNRIPGPDSP